MTAVEVVTGAGITQSAFYGFVKKGKSLSLEAGLKLLSFLDRVDDPLSELDEDEDDEPPVASGESARMRQLRNASAAAAASAAIDARDQPIKFATGGGVAGKADRVLTLGQLREVRRAMESGAKAEDLASAYRVSVRTIYRACEGTIEEGDVGGRKVVMQVVEGHEPRILGRPLEASV